MFKLGVMVKDKASGLKGACTHMQILGTGARWYNFQPAGLNPEDGSPVERSWVTEDRLEGPTESEPDLPLDAMGTEAEDTITGFKGTITAFIIHLNGCVHVQIQPKGKHPKTGKMIDHHEFDLRMVKGPKIPKLTERERKESERKTPSPGGTTSVRLKPM